MCVRGSVSVCLCVCCLEGGEDAASPGRSHCHSRITESPAGKYQQQDLFCRCRGKSSVFMLVTFTKHFRLLISRRNLSNHHICTSQPDI